MLHAEKKMRAINDAVGENVVVSSGLAFGALPPFLIVGTSLQE